MTEEFQEIMLNRAHVHIGKNGITPGMLEHISKLFQSHQMLKIKVMKEIAHTYGVDYFIEYLVKQTGFYILDVRGFTFILAKRKIRGLTIPKKYRPLYPKKSQNSPAKEEITTTSEEPHFTDPTKEPSTLSTTDEPAFIDYDNEELLEEIDQASDEIYGAVSTKNAKLQAKTEPTLILNADEENLKQKNSETTTRANENLKYQKSKTELYENKKKFTPSGRSKGKSKTNNRSDNKGTHNSKKRGGRNSHSNKSSSSNRRPSKNSSHKSDRKSARNSNRKSSNRSSSSGKRSGKRGSRNSK